MTSRKEETALNPKFSGQHPSSPDRCTLRMRHAERSLRGDDRTSGRLQAHA
ncbi:hypothetical protein ACWDUL_26365 [Nocardia niigatensis]|uniref:hypothetical protein n=1 Tax=Nocardia niigatensis TaxID=209249 RepID=UPI001C3F3D55|nr:hypothetical protein [Nocardia niigatensis]